jgi:ATP-dependent RNA helicase SUPV3L1/SUV3
MQGQLAGLDRTDGDIDALSARLARVRTLAYIANRGDWLADPPVWQERARALEDRLSDTLHKCLMQRFIDRRTSTLLRSLDQRAGPTLAGIGGDGGVTVEGHRVGRLAGVDFEPERGETALENRALRGVIERVVAPEIARRLGELAAADDSGFALRPGGVVLWRGEAVGEIVGGGPFAPRVRLDGEFGAPIARERAARRLEAFVAAEASRRLAALKRLEAAIGDGTLKGLARGLAYQIFEEFGVLDRKKAEPTLKELSHRERRILQALGVRFGAFSLYLPALLVPDARAVGTIFAELALPRWRPPASAAVALPRPTPASAALGLRGLRAVAGLAVPVATLERLAARARLAPGRASDMRFSAEILADLDWSAGEGEQILRGLGYVRADPSEAPETALWRRRRRAGSPKDTAAAARTPPAAPLATPAAPVPRKRFRRRRPRAAHGAAQA